MQPEADLSFMVKEFGIGDLRDALGLGVWGAGLRVSSWGVGFRISGLRF